MDLVEIRLKEYEALRQEIITTMEARNSILSFGLATIGIVLTVAIALVNQNPLLPSLVLIFIIPAISTFILFMWLGEYQRMQRAGKFLVETERRINEAVSSEVLSWETSLRSQRKHMSYPYNTTVLLLTIISLMSIVLGTILLMVDINLILIVALGAAIIHVAEYKYAISSMSKLRL